jgi:recombinational DNA repair protein (RecF pathway)
MPRADKNLENKAVNPFDLVKIKVTLDDNYYIFSRYLISRMLALIGVTLQFSQCIQEAKKQTF